jgi:hypothetical protein
VKKECDVRERGHMINTSLKYPNKTKLKGTLEKGKLIGKKRRFNASGKMITRKFCATKVIEQIARKFCETKVIEQFYFNFM